MYYRYHGRCVYDIEPKDLGPLQVSFPDIQSNAYLNVEVHTCANSECSQWSYNGWISGTSMNLWLPDAQIYHAAFRVNVSKMRISSYDSFLLKYGPVVHDVCGDGIQEALEACDDGNLIDGDGCSSKCKKECIAANCCYFQMSALEIFAKRYEDEVAPGATCASFEINDNNNVMGDMELAVVPTHMNLCAVDKQQTSCDRLELTSAGKTQVLLNEFQVFRGRSLTLHFFSNVNNRSSPFPFNLSWGGKSKSICGNGLRDWTFRMLTSVNCTSTKSLSYTSTINNGMGGVWSQNYWMSSCNVAIWPVINTTGPMYLLVEMASTSLYGGSIMNVTLNRNNIPFSSPDYIRPTCGSTVPIVLTKIAPDMHGPKFSLQINVMYPNCWYCSSYHTCYYIDAVAYLATADVFEECDDGNQMDGDGCSSTCTVESGGTCNSSFSIGSLQAGPDNHPCSLVASNPYFCFVYDEVNLRSNTASLLRCQPKGCEIFLTKIEGFDVERLPQVHRKNKHNANERGEGERKVRRKLDLAKAKVVAAAGGGAVSKKKRKGRK
ncbi:hypothetical protein GUITHDRAFT_143338 [Guillardia theta CCMP2712]|uniref:DUF4215 domain-containing protein n=1 Tax=Guillardia theta (strain CCMP2712) TaxID=905079 RepID=L1ITU5_GUITC|nr:hypothetical protein GUITHDRAFT_143338 [Guillardia theta CCMP2712]EKX39537.1 hypothetical protein GUITHDRAFT_143338 [Guillardia theta CCMP2712]|eukprot:XP_005826517.1 hypothetical protein GUITHDRAFT_143338 [Guillardia theta CCMP2712]